MNAAEGAEPDDPAAPRHTDPMGLAVTALRGAAQSLIPIAAMAYGTGAFLWGVVAIVPAAAAIIAFSVLFAWIRWKHLTYVTGVEDIRVEQGIFSRNARSVPYERIQDVSLEQKLLPRLLGLAEVKFETGAGGKDEIALAYLSLEEGERLRELVRARKEDGAIAVPANQPAAAAEAAPQDLLFAMDIRRVATFGLFEFSLVIFALLLGAASQVDFLLPFPIGDLDSWYRLVAGQGVHIAAFGQFGAALAVAGAVLSVVAVGIVTGVAVTVARDYGFRLERTPKGFRRRRGLFNRTDTVLPAHRVQAAIVGTGLIRRRFGWHGLEFVSLAQDGAKTPNFAAVPFARLGEIWPVVRAAGIEPPPEDLVWRRPAAEPWVLDTVFHGLFFTVLAVIGWAVSGHAIALAAAPLFVGGTALVNYLAWRRHRHAAAGGQLFARSGTLAPKLVAVPELKLQTVEIAQSPLARRRGYATLHLGLAGGKLSLPGLKLEEARALRREIVAAIAKVDFSQLSR